jgi:hypothetical protein
MARRRHHVVSRGYQRFFADGERVLLIDKLRRTYKEVGTADCFVEDHFNSWIGDTGWEDDLEDEWQRLENMILPQVRSLVNERGTDDQREACKILAAIHFARSYVLREMQSTIGEIAILGEADRMAGDPIYIGAFTEQLGHAPLPGEIESYIADLWADLTANRRFLQERTVYAYTSALDMFKPRQVQFLYSREHLGFVLGDTPLITGDSQLFKVSVTDGIALGEAVQIWMPVTSGCSMLLHWGTDQELPKDGRLSPYQVQQSNWVSWRAARRFLICHPDQNPMRAFGGTPLTSENAKDGGRSSTPPLPEAAREDPSNVIP